MAEIEPSMRFLIRRSEDRGRSENNWLSTYHTFSFGSYLDPQYEGFGSLRVLNEDFIEPANGFQTHPHRQYEIFSYIVSGVLDHRDSMGNAEKVPRGYVQFTTAGTGIRHSEMNQHLFQPVHLLQLWTVPWKNDLKPGFQLKRFEDKKKINNLLPIIAPFAQGGDVETGAVDPEDPLIRIHQDLHMFATIFPESSEEDSAPRLIAHIPRGEDRKIYVHVVMEPETGGDGMDGVIINEHITLRSGDGVFIEGASSKRPLLIEAASSRKSEFILLDMAKEELRIDV
ncbi:RmlC-like cupin domain-containing protein [Cladochytrium replicatum]|nr:RmlC-like cupin domain-containing protein [Cladochytrium replicatum]